MNVFILQDVTVPRISTSSGSLVCSSVIIFYFVFARFTSNAWFLPERLRRVCFRPCYVVLEDSHVNQIKAFFCVPHSLPVHGEGRFLSKSQLYIPQESRSAILMVCTLQAIVKFSQSRFRNVGWYLELGLFREGSSTTDTRYLSRLSFLSVHSKRASEGVLPLFKLKSPLRVVCSPHYHATRVLFSFSCPVTSLSTWTKIWPTVPNP